MINSKQLKLHALGGVNKLRVFDHRISSSASRSLDLL